MKFVISFSAFLLSHMLVAQYGHLWTTEEFEKNKQYEGYVVDLERDTIRGFIQFADCFSIQDEFHFYLEKANKKTDTIYRPTDLLWYHFLDKTYQCINYSGGLSTKLIKGNLLLERGCISKHVWFNQAEDFVSQRREADETLNDYMNRLYPSVEVYYNKKQRKAITEDYFLLSFEKRMSSFIRENQEVSIKVKDRERGYGFINRFKILQEYNEKCQ